jgi:hypothetical protein
MPKWTTLKKLPEWVPEKLKPKKKSNKKHEK